MKLTSSLIKPLLVTCGLLAVGAFSSARAQVFDQWNSTSSTDPSVAANWSNAPTLGAVNAPGILEAGSANINYTSAFGTTTFGTSAGANFAGLSWLGYGNPNGINVTGGVVNFNGAFSNDGGVESIWMANGAGNTGFITVNGGTITVLNGTVVGRDGASGALSVNNGSFTTGDFSSSVGMTIGLVNGTGLATIGNGGLISVTGAVADPLEFNGLTAGANNTTNDFVNFSLASTGVLQLNLSGATLGSSYFTALVDDGYIEVGGVVDTNVSDFTMNTSTLSASTLELVQPLSVPEPSAWATMLGGMITLGFIARRRVTS